MNEVDKVLVIEDEENIATQLKCALSKDCKVLIAHDRDSAREKLKEERPHVVTLDLDLPPKPRESKVGLKLLEDIVKTDPLAKVVVITGDGNANKQNALKAIRMGAYDFYYKPIDVHELKVILKRAFHIRRLERKNLDLQKKAKKGGYLENLIGTSPRMKNVFSIVRKVATTDFSVMIQGESGTGKEVVARAIHLESPRKNRPFVTINCGAIPETLLESELFGYEKGAFTGAYLKRKGKLEVAHRGTVFLDEVADLTLSLQVKLLRFLQEHTIERIGGRDTIELDVRVIAATNRDLTEAVQTGIFREDLYYRLNTLCIQLPPLRDRGKDITLLAKFFLDRYCLEAGKKTMNLSEETTDAICQYGWPGNIRQLQNRIKRAIIMARGPYILPKDLGLDQDCHLSASLVPNGQSSLKETKDRFEKNIIIKCLEKTGYNISRAASQLMISRACLYHLIKKYHIEMQT